MSFSPDIRVYSADGNLQLVAEVKGVIDTDSTWAAQYRSNLLNGQVFPLSPYFLLVASDHIYLWKNVTSLNAVEPTAQGDTKAVLGSYLPSREAPLSTSSLEIVVRFWLSALTYLQSAAYEDDAKRLLLDTGLRDAIRSGSMAYETVQ